MYTQCHECLSIYQISAEQLKSGRGETRCGHCGHVFNALLTLIDKLPDTAIDELPRAQVEALPPVLDVPVMHSSKQASLFVEQAANETPAAAWVSFTPPEPSETLLFVDAPASASKPATAPFLAKPADDGKSAIDGVNTNKLDRYSGAYKTNESHAKVRAPERTANTAAARVGKPESKTSSVDALDLSAVKVLPSTTKPTLSAANRSHTSLMEPPAAARRWPWILLSVILLLLLLAQSAWLARDKILAKRSWRPGLERVCGWLGCELPLQQDFDKLSLLDRDVKPHPSATGALLISASVRNDADFVQAFPVVEVRLLNLRRDVVAARRFLPSEYLQDPNVQAQGFMPNAALPVVFEVIDPGRAAVNFEFAFIAQTDH